MDDDFVVVSLGEFLSQLGQPDPVMVGTECTGGTHCAECAEV